MKGSAVRVRASALSLRFDLAVELPVKRRDLFELQAGAREVPVDRSLVEAEIGRDVSWAAPCSDELDEALWGERPPETARTALYGHISALRKRLGAERIGTRPPGYVLRLAD